MIEDYLVDTIDIITDLYDQNGVKTGTTTQVDVAARIEDRNQTVRNQKGQEVASSCYVMIDREASLSYISRMRLTKQNGESTQYPTKEWAILRLGKAHGFDVEFWRAWL